MATAINILIVEDSADDAALLVHALESADFDPKWTRVDTEPEYAANLSEHLNIIVSDFTLPKFSTLRALTLLQESKLDIPFVIVSGTLGEERAVESLKAGATDYVLKGRLDRLGLVVCRALREVRERTERKQFENQFIEAQKMQVIGQLAGGVAHDFNNILGVIMGYSSMIASSLAPDSPLQLYAEEIRLASERAAGLTRQLLVVSRKQTVQPVVLDLKDVVEDTESLLRRLIGENIEMTILPGSQPGHIKADAGYVGQVLMNLVVNARDAMPKGGQLTIATECVTVDAGQTSAHTGAVPGDYVMLSVRDTGIGMTEKVKLHLFEAFFTTKTLGKGTGLGLATCQAIVEQSGGYIRVESKLGEGTTFKIYFPRVEQLLSVSAKPNPTEPLPHGTETLLIVEDEPSLRRLACGVLETQGYYVLSATDGQHALHVARAHKGSPILLVISDVIMPLMGGELMAEWLKATYPELKILFTSGYTDDAIAHHGVLEPGVEFLPKPYTPATLAHKVREVLDRIKSRA